MSAPQAAQPALLPDMTQHPEDAQRALELDAYLTTARSIVRQIDHREDLPVVHLMIATRSAPRAGVEAGDYLVAHLDVERDPATLPQDAIVVLMNRKTRDVQLVSELTEHDKIWGVVAGVLKAERTWPELAAETTLRMKRRLEHLD